MESSVLEECPYCKTSEPEWKEGELPPVGTECEVINRDISNPKWEACKILFIGNFVAVYTSESCVERVGRLEDDLCEFRPIKSHRDKVIEKALDINSKAKHSCMAADVYGMLYDVGMLKMPEGG